MGIVIPKKGDGMKKEPLHEQITLLGDSIFDNTPYVKPGEDVISHLRRMSPDKYYNLLAVDGAKCADIEQQLKKVPPHTRRIFLSIGGNDALEHTDLLEQPAKNMHDAMCKLTDIRAEFKRRYALMLGAVLDQFPHPNKLYVCTIYDKVPGIPEELLTALALFNDVIIKWALYHGINIIDLRTMFMDKSHYSSISPIEPSELGGELLAETIIHRTQQ